MSRILAKLVKNKTNGQVNISLPKKLLNLKDKKLLEKAKRVLINLERFE